MLVILVLTVSILLQFSSAFFAFRLIKVTGKTYSWIFISSALFLMGVRRLVAVSNLIIVSQSHMPDLISELVALVISSIMFFGVIKIRPIFMEHKRAEEALRKSEDKFKYVFEHSIIGKSITLPSGEIYVNNALSKLLGYSMEELKNKKWQDITHPDDIELTQEAIDPILAGKKESEQFIKRYIHKNGSVIWADVGTSLRRDETGKPLYFMTSVSDITSRKQAEETLREHDAIFAKISSQVPGMLYQFERKPDGTFTVPYSSNGVMEIFGCSPEDVRNNFEPIFKAIIPEDRDKILQTIEESAKSLLPWMCEYRVQLPGEPVKWVLGNSIPEKMADGTIIWSGYNTDITERKLAEVALRGSERLLSSIYNTTGDVIFCLAVEANECYRFISVNQAFYKITGLRKEMVIGKLANEIIPEPSLSMVLEKYRQAIEKSSTIQWEEISNYPNGKVTGEVNISPVMDDKGTCVHLVGSVHDITEQKKMLDMLTITEFRYRRLFESAKDGILILDAETGKIIDVNPFLIEMLNYSRDQFIEKAICEIGFFKDTIANQDKFMELQQMEYVRYEDLPLETNDGRKIDVEFVSNVYSVNHQKVIQCNIRNITERKRAEKAIKEKANELERFNNLMVGRELKMIDLKKEINGLLKKLGEEEKYRITEKEDLEKG